MSAELILTDDDSTLRCEMVDGQAMIRTRLTDDEEEHPECFVLCVSDMRALGWFLIQQADLIEGTAKRGGPYR